MEMILRKAVRFFRSSSKVKEWWMLGTGWLWLARALNVAGAVSFVFFVWTFLSFPLYWLLFFFMSLTSFSVAAVIKRRSVAVPNSTGPSGREDETAIPGGGGAKALVAAFPPAPMFDREGRTPLERVFKGGEGEGKDAGPGRAG
jgi:hypothetical protein